MKLHIGDILTIITGVMLTTIDRLYSTLDQLTGDNLMTHQLPEAARKMKPVLVAQLPWVADIPTPQLTGERECRAWVARMAETYGEWHEVAAPSVDVWGIHDPIEDFYRLRGLTDDPST